MPTGSLPVAGSADDGATGESAVMLTDRPHASGLHDGALGLAPLDRSGSLGELDTTGTAVDATSEVCFVGMRGRFHVSRHCSMRATPLRHRHGRQDRVTMTSLSFGRLDRDLSVMARQYSTMTCAS